MAQLLAQGLERVLRLLAAGRLLFQLAVDLCNLGHERVDQALLVLLAKGHIVASLLRQLRAALSVGQTALQAAVCAQTGLLAARRGLAGDQMGPLVLCGQGVEEGLGGLVEVHHLEELAAHAAGALLQGLLLFGAVLFELQKVLAVLGLLARDGGKVQADVDAEAAPARLGDLKGRVVAGAQGVLVRVEDFELDLVEPGGEGGVAVGLAHVDGPALGVVVGDALGAVGVAERWQGPGLGADDCGECERVKAGCVAAGALMLREMRLFCEV